MRISDVLCSNCPLDETTLAECLLPLLKACSARTTAPGPIVNQLFRYDQSLVTGRLNRECSMRGSAVWFWSFDAYGHSGIITEIIEISRGDL